MDEHCFLGKLLSKRIFFSSVRQEHRFSNKNFSYCDLRIKTLSSIALYIDKNNLRAFLLFRNYPNANYKKVRKATGFKKARLWAFDKFLYLHNKIRHKVALFVYLPMAFYFLMVVNEIIYAPLSQIAIVNYLRRT